MLNLAPVRQLHVSDAAIDLLPLLMPLDVLLRYAWVNLDDSLQVSHMHRKGE